MIIHTVVFKLNHNKGSSAEKNFLNAAMNLASITGVHNLQSFRQISKKNNFDFGLSMEFKTQESYEAYNQHPKHIAFFKDFWLEGVKDFLEIDYEPLP